jgi:very-short-patch-repair endonuclease
MLPARENLSRVARGMIVVRFSWRQVRYEPEMVIAQIAALLAQRRAA